MLDLSLDLLKRLLVNLFSFFVDSFEKVVDLFLLVDIQDILIFLVSLKELIWAFNIFLNHFFKV
jgi:hypothetical protein